MSLETYLRGLRARFDRVALRAPKPVSSAGPNGRAGNAGLGDAALRERNSATWQALVDWCFDGAGPGTGPLWPPGAQPDVARRMAVAQLVAPDPALARAWAEALAHEVDGSLALAALPGAARRLLLRLRVKLADACWWRARRRSDPWDTGWASTSLPGLRQLTHRFRPRRATLILADAREQQALTLALANLFQASTDLHHPVRWLWVGDAGPIPSTPTRFVLP